MYVLDKFLKILIDIDFFAIKPKFNINNKYSYGTYYGAIISICICIVLSIVFFTQFFKIILHSEPTLITTIYNDEDPKKLNITPNNFVLTFSLQDINYNNYINESIYFVSATLANVNLLPNGSNNVIETNLSVIKCSDYNFSLLPEYFKNLPLNNLYCINESLISIQGQFKKNIWSYINLRFYICNKNNLNNCATDNEIKSKLNGGYIGIFMTDFNVLPNNYSNPSNIFGTNVYNAFSIKNHIDYWIYLKPIEVITDNGYFMQNKKKDDFFGLDYLKSDIYYLDDNSNFLTLVIRVSPRRDVYERSYLKIQGAAATIGGMINLCISVGQIITYFFNLTLYKYFFLQFFNTEDKLFKIPKIKTNIKRLKSYKNNVNNRPKLNNNCQSVIQSENNVINLKKDCNILNAYNINLNNKENNCSSILKNDSKQNLNIILYENDNKNNNNNNDILIKKNLKIKNLIENNKIKYKTHYLNKSLKIKNNNNLVKKYDFKSKPLINNSNINVKNKKENKSLFSGNNLIEHEIDNNNDKNSNNSSLMETKFPIINFRQKRLKKYVFCTKIFCKRRCCIKVSDIHKNFNQINFLFDLIHFLKTKNEVNLLKNEIYNYEQRKALNTMYTFDSDFYHEKLAYDLIIIKHKN